MVSVVGEELRRRGTLLVGNPRLRQGLCLAGAGGADAGLMMMHGRGLGDGGGPQGHSLPVASAVETLTRGDRKQGSSS